MIYWGLHLFFVLEYVRPGRWLPAVDALMLGTLFPIALSLAAVVTKGRATNRTILRDPITGLVFAWLAIIGFSLLTAPVTFYAFQKLKGVFGYLLMFWVIAKHVGTTGKLRGVFRTLVAVHLALAALNPQLLTNPEVRSYLVGAPFLGDGNDFALSVNVAIPLCYGLMITGVTTRARALYAVMLPFLVACVVATQSRGGTVALACVAVYYWLRTRRKVATALVVAVVAALVLVLAPDAYFARMQTISTTDGSAQGRIDSWKAAWGAALQHPVLGVGAGHFNVSINPLTAHSVYFLALGELGFPGLGVIVLLMLANLVANRRLITEIRNRGPDTQEEDIELLAALSASLIAFAVGGAFLSALYYPHLYVLAGMSVAGRGVVREKYLMAGATIVAEPSRVLGS